VSILSAQNLSKRYGGRAVVEGVSLIVHSGEIVGLLGPNGAGKTTCFYMIVGLVPCESGSVHLDEKDMTALPMHARARLGLGYLPQEPSIFRKLSVADNIMAILEARENLPPANRERRLHRLLEDLHIEHLRGSRGDSLSGGERRRAEIARALASEPQFVLLDEPFAGVDPISVGDINKIIKYLSGQRIGVLITDHSVRETLSICDRGYIVNEGRILCEGRPEVILEDERVRAVYLGDDFRL